MTTESLPPDPARAHATAAPAGAESEDCLRVLLAVDDSDLRFRLTTMLSNDGHRPALVGDGVRGLLEFLSGEPDVVIVDPQLPGMDGSRLIVEILMHAPQTPVIVLTSDDAPVASAVGSIQVLARPISPGSLRAAIAAALSPSRAGRAQPAMV